MTFKRPKHLGWIVTAVLLIAFVGYSMIPKPLAIDLHTITSGPLMESIDAEGRTQFDVRYMVTMPASGMVSRISIEPGDSVRAGDVIATYTPPVLDARQRSSAQQRANAAAALYREAQKRLKSLEPIVEQAQRRADRTKRLVAAGAISKEQAENSADAFVQITNEYAAAQSRANTAEYESQAARIAASAAPGSRVKIYSPISGVILRRFQDQENTLMAGQPLVEIGDPTTVEVVIDVLSTDAVRITKGLKVVVEGWGGGSELYGTIRRIEPAARVKISSLGVEEKRVDVYAELEKTDDRLGDAYKVDARIVTWETDNAVRIPVSALHRKGTDWFTFVVREGVAHEVPVEVGHFAALTAEVTEGIEEGDQVVIHPPEELVDQALVEEREF